MDNERGDILGPPHGTTPAAVIAHKEKLRSFKIMRKGMGQTAVSATKPSSVPLYSWQYGAKENYCNFATFNRIVDSKTIIVKKGPNCEMLRKLRNVNTIRAAS